MRIAYAVNRDAFELGRSHSTARDLSSVRARCMSSNGLLAIQEEIPDDAEWLEHLTDREYLRQDR
jgi:hypothetical protein